jgi:hypothetical protein
VDKEFMDNLSPMNRLVLYGTCANIRGRNMRAASISRGSSASTTTSSLLSNITVAASIIDSSLSHSLPRRRSRLAAATLADEETVVNEATEYGSGSASKRIKRESLLEAVVSTNATVDSMKNTVHVPTTWCAAPSFSNHTTPSDITTVAGLSEHRAEAMTTSETQSPNTLRATVSLLCPASASHEPVSALQAQYFHPQINLLRPPITGGQVKSRQLAQQQWEQRLLQLDAAEMPVGSSFEFWLWLEARHTFDIIPTPPLASHEYNRTNSNGSNSSGNRGAWSALDLHEIGCHVGHAKFFAPLELQEATQGIPLSGANSAYRSRSDSIVSVSQNGTLDTTHLFTAHSNLHSGHVTPYRCTNDTSYVNSGTTTARTGRSRSSSFCQPLFSQANHSGGNDHSSNNNNNGNASATSSANNPGNSSRSISRREQTAVRMVFDEAAAAQDLSHRQHFTGVEAHHAAVCAASNEREHNVHTVKALSPLEDLVLELERDLWQHNLQLNQRIAALRRSLLGHAHESGVCRTSLSSIKTESAVDREAAGGGDSGRSCDRFDWRDHLVELRETEKIVWKKLMRLKKE